MTTPKPLLIASWVRKYRLSRRAASSIADGGAVQVARADQADQPVAQILPLQQDEDRDDEDDRRR